MLAALSIANFRHGPAGVRALQSAPLVITSARALLLCSRSATERRAHRWWNIPPAIRIAVLPIASLAVGVLGANVLHHVTVDRTRIREASSFSRAVEGWRARHYPRQPAVMTRRAPLTVKLVPGSIGRGVQLHAAVVLSCASDT